MFLLSKTDYILYKKEWSNLWETTIRTFPIRNEPYILEVFFERGINLICPACLLAKHLFYTKIKDVERNSYIKANRENLRQGFYPYCSLCPINFSYMGRVFQTGKEVITKNCSIKFSRYQKWRYEPSIQTATEILNETTWYTYETYTRIGSAFINVVNFLYRE